jgi:hypothetical protein
MLLDDPVVVDAGLHALRAAVVPLDEYLKLVRVVDRSADANPCCGASQLDPVTFTRYLGAFLISGCRTHVPRDSSAVFADP